MKTDVKLDHRLTPCCRYHLGENRREARQLTPCIRRPARKMREFKFFLVFAQSRAAESKLLVPMKGRLTNFGDQHGTVEKALDLNVVFQTGLCVCVCVCDTAKKTRPPSNRRPLKQPLEWAPEI